MLPIGGASAFGDRLAELLSDGFTGRVAGLCDEGEIGDLQRGLERAGLGSDLSREDMEALGFYVCVVDLEDELIRALGTSAVVRAIKANGELSLFRTFQNQPEWRARTSGEQLRRFLGTRSGRKARYGRVLVDALDLSRVPRPLEGVLAHV